MSLQQANKMVQVDGVTGEEQTELLGGERIFSRKDTEKIVELARNATNPNGLAALGRFVHAALKRQDKSTPEYTQE